MWDVSVIKCSDKYCPYNWFCCRERYIPLTGDDEKRMACEHWDPKTHKCKIYEERPECCRDAQCIDIRRQYVFRFNKAKGYFNRISDTTRYLWEIMRALIRIEDYQAIKQFEEESEMTIRYGIPLIAGISMVWFFFTVFGSPLDLIWGIPLFLGEIVFGYFFMRYGRKRGIEIRRREYANRFSNNPPK